MLILIGDRILLTNLDFQLRNAKITRFWNRVKSSDFLFYVHHWILILSHVFNVMDNIREYQLYLEALDENKSAFERRNAIKRLYECRTEESLYFNEIIVDSDGLVPDWIKKIAREYYVDLCLEYL